MKKKLIIILILILVVGGGIYLFDLYRQKTMIVQSHRTYSIQLISGTDNLKSNKQTGISYQIVDENGNVLKAFALNHTKKMHFIIVRKDLQDFQHIHPNFNQNSGTFSIPVTFPEDGSYRLFADFTPDKSAGNPNLNDVVASKDITVGSLANYHPKAVTVDTATTKSFGDYTVNYSFPTSDALLKKSDIYYTLSVSKNGQDVTDLQPYLGALAHAIILKENTLDYIHAHAMLTTTDVNTGESSSMGNMPGMNMGDKQMSSTTHNEAMNTGSGPKIQLSTYFPTAGIYKIFAQFEENNKVITTDYTIQVNN